MSEPLIAWLEESQHPVLDNAFARSIADGRALNLVSPDEAVRRIDAGERVYTNSENALAWVVESAHNESLSRAIGLFKDKAAMRAAPVSYTHLDLYKRQRPVSRSAAPRGRRPRDRGRGP